MDRRLAFWTGGWSLMWPTQLIHLARTTDLDTVAGVKRRTAMQMLAGVGVLAFNALAFFSQSVANWWGDFASPDHYTSGSSLARLLTWRASLQGADVHFVMWFVAGMVVMAACTTRRMALLACSALVALGLVIEVLQPVVSTRIGQMSDAVAGTLGVLTVFVVRAVVLTLRRRTPGRRFTAA